MYDIDDKEDLIAKLNVAVEAVQQLDADEVEEIIELLDSRLRAEDRDSCMNMGTKAMLLFSTMYREPEKAKALFNSIKEVSK